MTGRLALERRVLGGLLTADGALVRRLRGLQIAGVGRAHFSGSNAHLFGAIVTLAHRGDRLDDAAIARETKGRIDVSDVAWLRTAYGTDRSLYGLAIALRDAERRSLLASVGAVATNAARDPAADIDRTIAILVAQLRRARRGDAVRESR